MPCLGGLSGISECCELFARMNAGQSVWWFPSVFVYKLQFPIFNNEQGQGDFQ